MVDWICMCKRSCKGLSRLSSEMVELNFRVSVVPAAEFVCVKPRVGAGVAQEASTRTALPPALLPVL